jgi:DNA mismatch repair protein MutL
MGKIQVLDKDVSNKIAAGEVVERPVSVVKELVENSIDAGASVITVEIKNGGSTYIRVTDNGAGMSASDAEIAFLRHATSKIQTADDLDAIYTLGFRGEALSSIGAVAEVDLFTKRAGDDEGAHVVCCGGDISSAEAAGAADGTTFVVKNLFYNTPARMKFLKKDATEAGYISDIMSRFVLAHPEISFRFISNGRDQIFSSGDNDLKNAVYTVYGKDYAKAALEVDYDNGAAKISGIAGNGSACRPNRGYQTFFVNKRYIKSALIIRAVEDAYKNQIMIGKFPMAALNIEIDPSMIDINIHPTKLEVKFSDEKLIYETVYFGVKNALYRSVNIPKIEKTEKPEKPEKLFEASPSEQTRMSFSANELKADKIKQDIIRPVLKQEETQAEIKKDEYKEKRPQKVTEFKHVSPDIQIWKPAKKQEVGAEAEFKPAVHEPETKAASYITPQEESRKAEDVWRVVGQVFSTYVLVERGEEMLMIDQHAAHERLKYEQLKKELGESRVVSQILLVPAVVSLTAVEYAAYKENKDFLEPLGFEIEDFGDNSLLVRSVPQEMEHDDAQQVVAEMLTELINHRSQLITEKQERLLYTIACKAAVKANRAMSEEEMRALVRDVMKMDNINTCPHGRPIMISMSKKEMEKEFKRIV